MNISKYKYRTKQHKIQNKNYEEHKKVSEFKYLCSLVTYDNNC